MTAEKNFRKKNKFFTKFSVVILPGLDLPILPLSINKKVMVSIITELQIKD